MPDNNPENELKEIWRSQATESMEMRLAGHRLRQKARDLRLKSRRELLNSLVLAALIAAGSVYGSFWTHSAVAQALFAVTAAWVSAGQIVLHRTTRQSSPPEDAGKRTNLDSCRRELERHIRFDRGVHLWLGGPLFLAFGALVVAVGGEGILVKMARPILALLVVSAVGTAFFRRSQEREYRRAIEELIRVGRDR